MPLLVDVGPLRHAYGTRWRGYDLASGAEGGELWVRGAAMMPDLYDAIIDALRLSGWPAQLNYAPLRMTRLDAFQREVSELCGFGAGTDRDWKEAVKADAAQLRQLYNAYGSDKGAHGYHHVYAHLLHALRRTHSPPRACDCACGGDTRGIDADAARPSPLRLLEIGLGTRNRSFVSVMAGTNATQAGASLRAHRDFLRPHAKIFGADIDAGVLFTAEHIRTAQAPRGHLTARAYTPVRPTSVQHVDGGALSTHTAEHSLSPAG